MEQTAQDDIKAHLMQTSEHYRELHNRHSDYERQVQTLEQKTVLTAAEELEEHRLKKLKLQVKDEMEHVASEYRLQHAN